MVKNIDLYLLFCDVGVMGFKNKEKKSVPSFSRYQRESNYSVYKLISAAGIIMICALLVIIGAQYIRQQRVKQGLAELEFRIDRHEQFQEAAEKEIERLQDLNYIEFQARKRLGLIKPGETIFQLED